MTFLASCFCTCHFVLFNDTPYVCLLIKQEEQNNRLELTVKHRSILHTVTDVEIDTFQGKKIKNNCFQLKLYGYDLDSFIIGSFTRLKVKLLSSLNILVTRILT